MSKAISSVNRGVSLPLIRFEKRGYCSFSGLSERANRAGGAALTNSNTSHRLRTHVLAVRPYAQSKDGTEHKFQSVLLKGSDIKGTLPEDFKIESIKDAMMLYKMLEGEEFPQDSTKTLFWEKNENCHPFIPIVKFPYGIWTRGSSNLLFDPSPGVFRTHRGYFDETSMVHHFKLSYPHHSNYHKTHFDWLTLMEHYLVPSRLLNWSKNILVSLYFATAEDPKNDNQDGAIWLLNPFRLNKYSEVLSQDKLRIGIATANSFNVAIRSQMAVSNDVTQWLSGIKHLKLDQYDSPEQAAFDKFCANVKKFIILREEIPIEPDKEIDEYKDFIKNWERLSCPLAIVPQAFSERLRAQSGVFTLHSGKLYYSNLPNDPSYVKLYPGTKLYDLQKEEDEPFLRLVEIPSKSKKLIRDELSYCGISEATIYPELEHQIKGIEKYFLHSLSGIPSLLENSLPNNGSLAIPTSTNVNPFSKSSWDMTDFQ